MNDEQLLGLLANEVDQLDNLTINDSLKKLAEGCLSAEEEKKLHKLAESNPKLQLALKAYTPFEHDFFTHVENVLDNSGYIEKNSTPASEGVPGINNTLEKVTLDNTSRNTAERTSNSMKKNSLVQWFNWLQSNASWPLGSACAATIALITISLFNLEESARQNSESNSIPNYAMEISGGNTQFRGHDSSSSELTLRSSPQTIGDTIEVYPENRLTITLRPSLAYKAPLEEKLLLVSKSQHIELQGNISYAPSGAIKISIDRQSPWNTGEAQLVAIVARQGFLPSNDQLSSLLNLGVRTHTSDNWLLLSRNLAIKE